MFSSRNSEWATPQALFELWDAAFHFEVDVCATSANAKCKRFFSPEEDGLAQRWAPRVCWMNPPYGREIAKWVKKADEEAERGATVVCLLPARTDTKWWHAYIQYRHQVVFLKGRFKFVGAKHAAPFPSCIVVM